MQNNAFVKLEIKDGWSAHAYSIAKATDKMSSSIKNFEKQFNTTSGQINGFTKKIGNASRSITEFNKKVNALDRAKVINLSNLIKGDLSKQLKQVDQLIDKINHLNSQISGAAVATGATRKVSTSKEGKQKAVTSSVGERRILGGLLSTGIGVAVLRSSIVNARDFHVALYDIERQLGQTENLQDYIKFIEEYSLKTGRANIEVAQQTAELLKTRKAGDGLNTIADRMDIATYATRQLKLASEDAAQGVEILGSAYTMTTDELKGFFAQANAIEDVYGTVTGSDIVQVLRRNIALLKNAKLLPKAEAIQLAAFAKANTSIEPTAVGTALSRIVSGGKGAFGGGYIKRAEQENKTLGDIILADAKLYGQLKTQTEKNEFTRSRLVGGNSKGNIRDIEVLNSIFIEGTKINMERVQSFLQVEKQYKQGTVSAATYRKELVQLTNAEQATVYSLQSTEDSIKSFNNAMQLLSVQHESTLGTISNSWKSISTVFADVALYPLFLDPLAKGLRVLTPAMTAFIKDEPALSAAIGAVGVALLGLFGVLTVLPAKSLGFAKALAAFGALKQLSGALAVVSVGLEASKLAVDAVTGKSTSSITPMIKKGVDNIADTSIGQKIVGSNFMQSVANSKLFGGSGSSMAIPTPLTQPQLQPKGEISVNVTVNGQAQVQTEVKRQDNMSLNLSPTTSRSPL